MSKRPLRINCLVDREIHPELYDDLVQCDPRKRADRLRYLAALAARGATSREPPGPAQGTGSPDSSPGIAPDDPDDLGELFGDISFT